MTDKIPEMVERVARAIAEADRTQWDHMFAPRKAMFASFARAAIAAMHDPTKAMIDSADKLDRGTLYDPRELDPEEIWKAMIDEAMR